MTKRGGRRLRVAAVLMGLVLLIAACGSDNKNKASGNAASSGSGGGGGSKAGALEGVKGTTPLVDLPADFKTKLDAQGKAVSSALVVTAPGARPMSFELASAADGTAYIGFRGDDSTPGASGGALQLVQRRQAPSL